MRRRLRLLSDLWKSLVFIVTIRAAAKPCRSRRIPPAGPEVSSMSGVGQIS
ncbi:hypothetical protein [Caulobacter sp.]|uniref:hypothetical protein n=1 Tax=Caulobacter sp. TaxID=78 RepID=UPI002B4A8680|nr:hypothetical protein [Caulobacter sp.]HJV41705.1 hypothetical protein [Caulobacter sp.]